DCSMIGYETYMKKNNNEDIGFDTYMKTCRGEIKVVGVLPFRSYRLECEVEAEKAKVVDGFTNPDDKYYFIEACIREKEKGRGQDLSNGEGKESDRAEGLPVTISKKQFSSPSSFNLQSHLNSTCGKTSQVTIGGVTCYCV